MEHPEFLYWALVALFTLPSVPFNRIAGVVVLQRVLTQAFWEMGAPEPPTQAITFISAAFLCAFAFWKGWIEVSIPRVITALFFLPMAVGALYQVNDSWTGWWIVYGFACVQAVVIPFGNDWAMVKEAWEAVTDLSWIDGLFKRTRHD